MWSSIRKLYNTVRQQSDPSESATRDVCWCIDDTTGTYANANVYSTNTTWADDATTSGSGTGYHYTVTASPYSSLGNYASSTKATTQYIENPYAYSACSYQGASKPQQHIVTFTIGRVRMSIDICQYDNPEIYVSGDRVRYRGADYSILNPSDLRSIVSHLMTAKDCISEPILLFLIGFFGSQGDAENLRIVFQYYKDLFNSVIFTPRRVEDSAGDSMIIILATQAAMFLENRADNL